MNNGKQKISNPYLAGKQEWMERYGSLIKQNNTYKIIVLLSLVITFLSVGGMIYVSSQSKIVPYLVEVDKLGRTVATSSIEATDLKDKNVIKSDLSGFIFNWRSIWGDKFSQKKFIFDAYKHIKNGSLAYHLISNEYRKSQPFKKLDQFRVQVHVQSVLQMSANNWQVDWEEITTDTKGKVLYRNVYRGLFIIEQIVPTTEQEIRDNPLGNFITEINYSRIID